MPDLKAQLCGIIGVEYSEKEDDIDFEALQRRQEKLRVLREVTDDPQIFDNVDAAAFDQDELFDILDEAPAVIYLYGDKFSIPFAKSGITYIGVNNPAIFIEKSVKEYQENEIFFQNVRNDELQKKDYTIKDAEDMILEGRYQEAFPIIKKLAENGDARAMYHMARYYYDGYDTVQINLKMRNEWLEKGFHKSEPLSTLMYAAILLSNEKEKQKEIFERVFESLSQLSTSGDVIAQCQLGYMYAKGMELNKTMRKP